MKIKEFPKGTTGAEIVDDYMEREQEAMEKVHRRIITITKKNCHCSLNSHGKAQPTMKKKEKSTKSILPSTSMMKPSGIEMKTEKPPCFWNMAVSKPWQIF